MSPTPVFVGLEVENKRQSRYATLILALVALALIGTAYATRDMYAHPTPPSDCTGALEYVGTCVRASAPSPTPPPSNVSLYLGTLATAIFAIILVEAGWRASVTTQKDIVSAFSGASPVAGTPSTNVTSVPVSASPPSTTPAPSSQATTKTTSSPLPPPLGPHPVAGKNEHAFAKQTPTTIVANRITPDMIAPPKTAPKKGVDAKMMEATK